MCVFLTNRHPHCFVLSENLNVSCSCLGGGTPYVKGRGFSSENPKKKTLKKYLTFKFCCPKNTLMVSMHPKKYRKTLRTKYDISVKYTSGAIMNYVELFTVYKRIKMTSKR